MSSITPPKNIKEFPLVLIHNMTSLATSGFGVVVALAWNEAIKATVEKYAEPYLGANSGIFSLFIYAMIVTVLAVLVTMQLSSIEKKLKEIHDQLNPSEVDEKANARSKSTKKK